MNLKDNNIALAILDENQALQKRAFEFLHNICKGYGGDIDINSDTAIDFCTGFDGCEMCNINSMFISEDGKLYMNVSTCEYCTDYEVEVIEQDSVEILNILMTDCGDLKVTM